MGHDVKFTGLTNFPYLNGELGRVLSYCGGTKLLRVRVDSPRVHSEKGCPEYLECSAANLLDIEKDKEVVSKKREKLVLTRREAASPPAPFLWT